MSETKFTPGPWVFEDSCGKWFLKMNGSAEMCNEHYYPWCPDNMHDWYLIAAAPEMYETLEMVKAAHASGISGGFLNANELDRVESVLSKARGESNENV